MRTLSPASGLLGGVLTAAFFAAPAPTTEAPEYDPAAEVTTKGTVADIHESKVATDHPGLHLMLKTEAETVEVHLCPVQFLNELEFSIEKGDTLTVIGSRPKSSAFLVAREVRKGQVSLILRDAEGAPIWNR
jgi:hypothetical protein